MSTECAPLDSDRWESVLVSLHLERSSVPSRALCRAREREGERERGLRVDGESSNQTVSYFTGKVHIGMMTRTIELFLDKY